MEKKLELAVSNKTKAFEALYKNGSFPQGVNAQTLDEEIKKCQNEIVKYKESFSNANKTKFAGVAFVSLRTEQMKRALLKYHKLSRWQRFKLAFKDILNTTETKGGLMLLNKRLLITEAAEPGDIYWAHLGLTDREIYLRKLFGQSISFLLILGCTFVIYNCTTTENDLSDSTTTNAYLVEFLNFLLSIAIVVINKGLSGLTPKIVS